LIAPRDYGAGCYSLVNYLYDHNQFSENDVWALIRVAGEHGALPLAQKLGAVLNIPDKKISFAFEKSAKLVKNAPESGRVAHELFLIALGRVAKSDPEKAAEILSRYSSKFSESERAQGWSQIAMHSAFKLQAEALGYWHRAEGASLSTEAMQWRVRSALREEEWKLVKTWIAAMPANLRAEPTWVYWYARALRAEGRKDEANQLFASIADQTHFYGQLALEERGQKLAHRLLQSLSQQKN